MYRILSCALGAILMMFATAPGQAQEYSSTWEQVTESGVLRAGCIPGEPWGYKDPKTGEWGGFGPEIARLLAAELKVEMECVETTWSGAVPGLQANQFDIVAGLDATPQRAMAIDFSTSPMVYYGVAVLARRDHEFASWDELNNPDVIVSVPLGTSNDRAASDRLPDATFIRPKTGAEAIAAWVSGRSNLVVGSSTWLAFQNRALDNIGKVVVPSPASFSSADVGMRKESDKRWRDWVSVAIAYYYNRGHTQKIYDDFLRSRGMDPAEAPPILKEYYKF